MFRDTAQHAAIPGGGDDATVTVLRDGRSQPTGIVHIGTTACVVRSPWGRQSK